MDPGLRRNDVGKASGSGPKLQPVPDLDQRLGELAHHRLVVARGRG